MSLCGAWLCIFQDVVLDQVRTLCLFTCTVERGDVWWLKSHLSFSFKDCNTCSVGVPIYVPVPTSYWVWCAYGCCSRLKHLLPPFWLQSSPEAVTAFGNSYCKSTSKADRVPALLWDLLFLACLLCFYVKGVLYTITFTFHNNSMQWVLLVRFYEWETDCWRGWGTCPRPYR